MRARMKQGHRPIVINGAWIVPDHPAYWDVPANAAAAVDLLVQDGQVEYEPALKRSEGVPQPQLQTVPASAPRTPNLSRKR